jgi:3-oxoadipate enol-lactonase
MPFVKNQGTKIYWDEQGQGAPILLIMGLGYASAMWHRIRPALAQHFRTIAFDNRGVGLSDVPPGPYSIATMASDAAAALDAAGIARAHVFGVSMGGMIAQEFTLQYPAKTRSLILGCTAAGGPTAVRAESKVTDVLLARNMTPEQAREAILPYIYDAATARERIDEDTAVRRRWLPTPAGYLAQLQAVLAFESYSRLDRITAPTLVIHGKSDALVPPANGELIASRIPGARLVLLDHASHLFLTDQTEAAQKAILDFLSPDISSELPSIDHGEDPAKEKQIARS